MKDELREEIDRTKKLLLAKLSQTEDKRSLLRSLELRALYERIPELDLEDRAGFGQMVNQLKVELTALINAQPQEELSPLDVTAPFGANVPLGQRSSLLESSLGSIHPISTELNRICELFLSMGFSIFESREIDDDFHMFGSLNFPEGHPARDDYDTFMLEQTDHSGLPLIAPAHTSSMQNRILHQCRDNLSAGLPIAAIIPGRVFRNEDVDARHEHTFYQVEGIYVAKNVSIGNLIATLKTFLEAYFRKANLEVKTQPFYFPFTEPSLEFSLSCPFCEKAGCKVCSYSGWIELLGCGQIHPKVLEFAGIDNMTYSGFAWGMGVDRLIMMKWGVEDIRLFHSGRLDFLREFSPGGA
jgi:phenylalanyl-tRNA synthetase alpha chain